MKRIENTDVPEIELVFPQFDNEEEMTESEICVRCHGCCSYVTVPLEYPASAEQRDTFRWYLLHRNVEIYIDHDNDWNLLFKTPCDKLLPTGMCSIYETRPDICRDYSADNCSRTGKDYTHLFQDPQQLNRYLKSQERKTRKEIASNTKKKTSKSNTNSNSRSKVR